MIISYESTSNARKKLKPCPGTVLWPMWKSLLFGICHPLKDCQASVTRKFSKHPASKAYHIHTEKLESMDSLVGFCFVHGHVDSR